MAEERYAIENNQIYIVDPELGIDLKVPFNVPSLPDELVEGAKLESGEKVILKKDAEKKIEKAFLELKGKLHGMCRLFYPSSRLQGEMFYHENHLHGPSVFYSENGTILSKSWFCLGVRQGKSLQYYLSGNPYSVQRYKEGKMHGKQEFFYEDGSLKTIMHYENGFLNGEVKLFWPNAALKREVHFHLGKRTGWDKFWSEKKIILDEGEYKEGLPIGVHRRRYESGKTREEIVYHTPTKFDRKGWNEDGKLVYEGLYAADNTYLEKVWDSSTDSMQERRGYWDGEKLCWK